MTPAEWEIFRGDILRATIDAGGEIGGRVLRRYLDRGGYVLAGREIALALSYLSDRGYVTIQQVDVSVLTTQIIRITAAGQDLYLGVTVDGGVSV